MSRWYIIHAYSGFENKVRDSILSEAKRLGLEAAGRSGRGPDRNGHRDQPRQEGHSPSASSCPAMCSPSWLMNDDVYHLVKNTPKVTGFLGPNGKPQAITEAEAARMLDTKEEAAAAPKKKIKVDYEIGDAVKVLDGPFASFNGVVEELDFDRSRVKVSVSIFGRATPVELEFEQVERVK